VKSVSQWFVFWVDVYFTLIVSSNGPGDIYNDRHCYGRALLPMTSSSNGHHDVGAAHCYWESTFTFQIIAPKLRRSSLVVGPACQSPNVATGMNHRLGATVTLNHHDPLLRLLFQYATDSGYKWRQSTVHSLSSNQSLSLNSLFSKEWHPMTTTSARWRRRRSPQ
jgi:hypothetical protein